MKKAKPMRIGIDARSYSSGWTGIGRYVRNLVEQLTTIDTENEYVLFLPEEEYDNFTTSNPRVKKVSVNLPHYSWQEQIFFKRVIKREGLDLVHFPHFNIPLRYHDKFVVTIHDLTLSFFPGRKMTSLRHRLGYHLAIRHAARSSEHIIAVSKNTQKDLQQLLNISKAKISVIYESVEFDHYHNHHDPEDVKKAVSGAGITKPFMLYAGVWRNHKNLPGLLEAFKKILDRGLDYQLVLTGKPDPHYPEVMEKIAELELEKRVILPGFVPEEDLPLLFAGASLFVFPSFYEGFGLPPLEAMASGTPVITSNTSSMPEVQGGASEAFDPYDTEAIAHAMEKVLRDQAYQEELKKKGLLHVKQFSWKKMAQETLEVYKKVMRDDEQK